MALKIVVAGAYARSRSIGSIVGMMASTIVLAVAIGLGLAHRSGMF